MGQSVVELSLAEQMRFKLVLHILLEPAVIVPPIGRQAYENAEAGAHARDVLTERLDALAVADEGVIDPCEAALCRLVIGLGIGSDERGDLRVVECCPAVEGEMRRGGKV